jgi:acyl-coenzyme A thioesterase PaaI-like protein
VSAPRVPQPSYHRCFGCGLDNPSGLRVRYFTEGEQVVAEFEPQPGHEGFPGYVHGGIIYTLLDEVLSRTAVLAGRWSRTGRMDVRYRTVAPLGERYVARAWVERWRGRSLAAAGEVRGADGRLVAEARGLFFLVPEGELAAMLAGVDLSDAPS